ncbi:MAG: tetratricopeptide repeat protein [Methanotrichaceae archaeon]
MKPNVVISVIEAGTAAAHTFSFNVVIDDQTIISRNLTPVESQQIREISEQYASLFGKNRKIKEAKDYFEILGNGLFHLFFEMAWGQIKFRIDTGASLIVASKIPEALFLPWELLRLPDGKVLGFDDSFSIRRLPNASDLTGFAGQTREVPPGPLKVLFMACEPLDYEREEKVFLKAMEGLEISFEICDTGGFGELLRRVDKFKPHLVHLLGQAKEKYGLGLFSFQKEGKPDQRSSSDIGAALSNAGVQGIIFGGCQAETPFALDFLCQGIIGYVPLAISWNAPADISRALYSPLSAGKSIDMAIAQACRDVSGIHVPESDIYAPPALYAATDQAVRFNESTAIPIHESKSNEQAPLPGLTDGYAEDFVDRRRDLERLIPAMHEGSVKAVVITGPKGAGKSVLATSISQRLAGEGYKLITVYGSRHNPISAARIFEACISALDSAGFADDAGRLRSPMPFNQRMENMFNALNKGRFLIVLDNLELNKETGKVENKDLAELYGYLLRYSEGTRAIITSNALPADAMTMPRRAWEWQVGGLPEAAFIKFLLNDSVIAEKYSRGEYSYVRLQGLYASSAGLPLCLSQMRKALSKAKDENSNLCDEFTASLYNSLEPDSCLALSRAAVYGISVNAIGLEAVTGAPEYKVIGMAREWSELSLAYPVQSLWAIPSQIRSWLVACMSHDQLKAAHREAGVFLRDFAEAGNAARLGISHLDCLMEARGHLLRAGEHEQALSVTDRISGYLERRGYYSEIIRLNEELLGHEKHVEPKTWIASRNEELLRREKHAGPMIWIARSYLDQQRYVEAQEWYLRALDLGPDAAACQGLGTTYFRQGKYDLARESFQKAANICRISSDPLGEAAALHSLAAIDMQQNKNAEAREKLNEVLEIQERSGDLGGEAATLQDIAMLDLRQGDYGSARGKLADSLKLLENIGDNRGVASMLYNLASIDMDKGDYDLAQEEFQKALALKHTIGDRSSEAMILHNLGSIDVQKGDLESSKEKFMAALEIYQDLNDKRGEAGAFFQLGAVAIQYNCMHEGLKLMALANIILMSIGSEDVKNVEPIVERFASQLSYSQEQFMRMVSEITASYRRDKGRSLVSTAFGR